MDLVRIATAGSVDDGKSTLIGRLLLECKALCDDTLRAVEETSRSRGFDYTDLALVTDGLRAEREQGITIDVAYRYFSTPKRSFILADTPGHAQYTRNMVTGASTADLGIVLVDARHGLTEQSRRHLLLLSLLGVRRIVVAVNKMDLVGFEAAAFERVADQVLSYAHSLQVGQVDLVPVSALYGDNVTTTSERTPWYEGTSLLYLIEHAFVAPEQGFVGVRLPVQSVVRPHRTGLQDFRGYTGQLAGGTLRVGDEVTALPSGLTTTVTRISVGSVQVAEARSPMSVLVELADDLDISRGDLLCRPGNRPHVGQDLDAMVAWLGDAPLAVPSMLVLKHTTKEVRAKVLQLDYRLDVDTVSRDRSATSLSLNQIGRVKLRAAAPILWDPYEANRTTGSFLLIDPATNASVGAGMLVDRRPDRREET